MKIKRIEDIVEKVKGKPKKRIAIAFGEDPHSLQAAERGVREGIFGIINFARKNKVNEIAKKKNIDTSLMETVDVENDTKAVKLAVKAVREGRADVLMKGIVSSAKYLKGVLNKEWGLLPEGRLLSNAAFIEVPTYHKLLIVSDPGVIIKPTLEMKAQQIKYCVNLAKKIGIKTPKVALLSAVETVNPKMPSTLDAAIITQMNRRGQIKNCIIDGPLALDLAISKESAEIKKIDSPVAGDADILIFPDIETGNVFYKALTKLAHAKTAGILLGTTAPCILPSRGDSAETKFYSLLIASAVVEKI